MTKNYGRCPLRTDSLACLFGYHNRTSVPGRLFIYPLLMFVRLGLTSPPRNNRRGVFTHSVPVNPPCAAKRN